jgi:hypothetical protein
MAASVRLSGGRSQVLVLCEELRPFMPSQTSV